MTEFGGLSCEGKGCDRNGPSLSSDSPRRRTGCDSVTWLRALVIDARGDFDGVNSISSSDTVVDEKTVWPVAKSPATDFLPYSACLSGFFRSVR